MKNKFCCPDLTDKRIAYSKIYLEKMGYEYFDNPNKAEFIVLGVNPEKSSLTYNVPMFAGNINGDNIFDYTKNETFALYNAFLTAEGAISLACTSCEKSLINSKVLILGYGRIAKALERLLAPYTNNITICARNKNDRDLAILHGLNSFNFDSLTYKNNFEFIFNTVAHPVMNERELSSIDNKTMIIDLASFPGGVDKHFAKSNGINLIVARGLPAKYSPDDAGKIVAITIDNMLREGVV